MYDAYIHENMSIIITGNESKKVLMCIIISMILKSRMRQMSLVQESHFPFCYNGNGCTKEVLIKCYLITTNIVFL